MPFVGKTDQAVMVAVGLRNEIPQRPEEFIPAQSSQGDVLWALLKQCWATEPTARPKSPEVGDTVSTLNYTMPFHP